ncbi:MAG TPA: SMC-Scp complex subunit ScpB [Candidatus Paceibacterota bacterium]|nr:SMC-Scp complex subunit ScpB [Candidatus Paceibacterota bacterium]
MLTPPAATAALLFASGEPFEKQRLTKLLDIRDDELPIVLRSLTDSLSTSGLVVVETDTHVELRTAPETTEIVKKLRQQELARELGKGSLETLAVIAYQNGASRGEIDWVRGVNSSASLRILLMRGLIEKREDAHDKRRIGYSITTETLAHLGISRIEDLPRRTELCAKLQGMKDEKETTPDTSVPIE